MSRFALLVLFLDVGTITDFTGEREQIKVITHPDFPQGLLVI